MKKQYYLYFFREKVWLLRENVTLLQFNFKEKCYILRNWYYSVLFFAILRENVTIFFALKQNEGENYVKWKREA